MIRAAAAQVPGQIPLEDALEICLAPLGLETHNSRSRR
jgi:hypothetical protein